MKKLLEYIIELLLPRPKNVLELENMSPEKFSEMGLITSTNYKDKLILFDYRNPQIKLVIWEIKYKGNKKIAMLVAQYLYKRLLDFTSLNNLENPLILPIPISELRRCERGYNQCELLTDSLKMIDNRHFFEISKDILRKTKDTERQTTKNRTERLKNLKNCFAIENPEEIRGRNVILLDDVITTGATLDETSNCLISAGAKRVIQVAVAH